MEKKLILIVEDAQVCQDFIKLLFISNQNYKIISAYDSTSALEKVELYGDKIILMILDQTLPDIPGIELFKIFQQNPKLQQIPVIFQSGYNLEETCNVKELITNYKDITNIQILTKPYTQENFFEKIELVLGKNWAKSLSLRKKTIK